MKRQTLGVWLCALLALAHVHAHNANVAAVSNVAEALGQTTQAFLQKHQPIIAAFFELSTSSANDNSRNLPEVAQGESPNLTDESPLERGLTHFNYGGLWRFAPWMFGIFVCLVVAWAGTSISRGREVMWENENLFLKFNGDFDEFLKAASKHPGTVRDRWIAQLCLLAGDITPKPHIKHAASVLAVAPVDHVTAPKINSNTEAETLAPVKTAAPGTINAVAPAVPVSLNGFIADVLRPHPPNDLFQRQLDELFRLHSQTSNNQPQSFLEIVPDHSNQVPAGFQIFIEPLSNTEKQNAKECWSQLKENVLQQRDLRSWRVNVRDSLLVLSAVALVLAMLQLVAGVISFRNLGQTTCRVTTLEKDFSAVECSGENVKTCRSECKQAGTFRYHVCSVMSRQAQWVPLLVCPEDHTQ